MHCNNASSYHVIKLSINSVSDIRSSFPFDNMANNLRQLICKICKMSSQLTVDSYFRSNFSRAETVFGLTRVFAFVRFLGFPDKQSAEATFLLKQIKFT